MKTDSWVGSVVWGRIGGAVLLIVAFVAQGLGFDISAQDQQHAFGAIQTILASIGGLMIMISKLREKKKEKSAPRPRVISRATSTGDQQGYVRLTLLLFISAGIALTGVLSGCSYLGIDVKDSRFCDTIPEGSYSVLCEVTAKLGTTPEAVRIVTKVANLNGVDQWYTAQAADKFMAKVQDKVMEFQLSGGATWGQFSVYLLGQYSRLPPKVQASIILLKDVFGFRPVNIASRMLSDYDWQRINGNLSEQREILAPFLIKP